MDDAFCSDETEQLERRLVMAGSPYALEWANTPSGPVQQFAYGAKHLYEIVQKASKRGNKCFVLTEDGSISYEQIFCKANSLAHTLVNDFNVGAGDRIALAIDNRSEWIISFFAIVAAGCTVVLLDDYGTDLLRFCLPLVECKVFLSLSNRIPLIREAGFTGPIIAVGLDDDVELVSDGCWGFENIATKPCAACVASIDPDGEALIAFTSGSTGKPKAVVSSHRGVTTGLSNMLLSGTLANAANRGRHGAMSAPCPLILAPFSHISGYAQILLAAILGGRVALLTNWTVARLLSFVRCEGITSISGLNPDVTLELFRSDDNFNALKSLRFWNVNGVALRQSQIDTITHNLPHVIITTGYGLTETNGAICAVAGRGILDNSGSLGRLVPTVEVRVVDEDGNSTKNGTAGNIMLRGRMLMKGYLSADRSLSGLDDGWFSTGDIGYVSADRQLYLLGRCNEILHFGDYVISTQEAERFLTCFPDVADACLVKLTSHIGIEHLAIVLSPAEGCEVDLIWIRNEFVSKFGQSNSALFVFFCAALPRTPSGKIIRSAVMSLAESYLREKPQ